MKKQIWQLFTIFLLINAVFVANATISQQCQYWQTPHKIVLDAQLLYSPDWSNLTVSCLSEEGRFSVTPKPVRGKTEVDFLSGDIEIVIRELRNAQVFAQSLIHELTHAVQYQYWLEGSRTEGSTRFHLERIHAFNQRESLNGAWQALALLKQSPKYRLQAKAWLQAYATVFFCMEYQAWFNEARYAEINSIAEALMTLEAVAVKQGSLDKLANFINQATVSRLYPAGFNQTQLREAVELCKAGPNPLDIFSMASHSLLLNL